MAGNPNMSYVSPVLGANETHRANAEASAAKIEASRNSARAEGMGNTAMALAIKIGQLNTDLYEAKKALHGQIALRDALKAALETVAPEHELLDMEMRRSIREAAEAKTKPEDPWWP